LVTVLGLSPTSLAPLRRLRRTAQLWEEFAQLFGCQGSASRPFSSHASSAFYSRLSPASSRHVTSSSTGMSNGILQRIRRCQSPTETRSAQQLDAGHRTPDLPGPPV